MATTGLDFIEWLSPDMSKKVLMHLDDAVDIVSASIVSRKWREFVIVNGICKKLFARFHPEASDFLHVCEEEQSTKPAQPQDINCFEWQNLVKEHRIYARLVQLLNCRISPRNCIAHSVAASSTDNFPEESIDNTLESSERINRRPSYWSSGGQKDPSIPETLTYRLTSDLCVIEQINIQPFQAYFQLNHPIYSSKAVRFRMGHCLLPYEAFGSDDSHFAGQKSAADEYFWTYVSPTYPMKQVNVLQSFKLPKPILCVGGIVQIELLGRVQKQEMDGLFYICVCHVQVIGRPLPHVLKVQFIDTLKQFSLSSSPNLTSEMHAHSFSEGDSLGPDDTKGAGSSRWHSFAERIRQLRGGMGWNEVFMNTLLGREELDVEDDIGEDYVDEYEDEDDILPHVEHFP